MANDTIEEKLRRANIQYVGELASLNSEVRMLKKVVQALLAYIELLEDR